MRFLFVMDPVESMLPDKDTSFAFMRGAGARGHECLHCAAHQLFNRNDELFTVARPVTVNDEAPHTRLGAPEVVNIGALDAVFIRKDPPFDVEYAHLTQQLDLVTDETVVVNAPQGLRDANEKLYAFQFAEHMPETLVTSDPTRIIDFVSEVGGRGVIKPLDGAGGSGVLGLDLEDQNLRSILDIMTSEGRNLVIVQQYIPEVKQGDKRVLLLDGQPLGAILRVPQAGDLRANIHVGGTVRPTELDEGEQALVASVGPRLAAAGLFFVGLDLIAGRLIEVNVTSPTGIQELGQHTGDRPEERVIEWVEGRATAISG